GREPLGFVRATLDLLRLPKKDRSGRSKLNASFGAKQQFDAKFLFEIKNGLADCGLGNVMSTRCFAVVQILRNAREVAEVSKFHGRRGYREIRLLQAHHTISTIAEPVRHRRCQRREAENRNGKIQPKLNEMNMKSSLENKVALVTGGTSGIGKVAALALAQAGAKVVVAGRRETEGAEVVHAIQKTEGKSLFVKTDVSREADVKALVDKTLA